MEPRREWIRPALILGLGLVAAPVIARGQEPQPLLPNLQQRSGLIQRIAPLTPSLPPDPERDNWYDIRWADGPPDVKHVNRPLKQGFYGLFWSGKCSATTSYFFGSQGGSVGPECLPGHPAMRLWNGLFHPLRPVGMYYDQGAYVPIMDTDPLVPGPGPSPFWFPFYLRTPRGG
jgi:hypothetical protein